MPESRLIFGSLPQYSFEDREKQRKEGTQLSNVQRELADKYVRIKSSNPMLLMPPDVEAVLILGHGEVDRSDVLPFAQPLPTSREELETEQRIKKALGDLLLWKQHRQEAMPVIGLTGTEDQTPFMKAIADEYLANEHVDLRVPAFPLTSFGEETTSTKFQLEAIFAIAQQKGWQSIVIFTSDYHVPRVELLIERYKEERRKEGLPTPDVHVLWVSWAFDRKYVTADQEERLEQSEATRYSKLLGERAMRQ